MLWTIGYEGATPQAFDAVLSKYRIECVVDARAVAISRRKGFAKTALSTRLASIGISYLHLRGLGDPKEGRIAARAGNWKEFLKIFHAHLRTHEAIRDLSVLADVAKMKRIALLCYEADPTTCHRSIVAEIIASQNDVEVFHIRVASGDANAKNRTGNNTYQSLAAA